MGYRMATFQEQAAAILDALIQQDAWTLSEAMREPAAYPLTAAAMAVGIPLLLLLFRRVPWLDRNIERYALVATYMTIATVIFVEVIRRFVFSVQAPWSTTLPPYLFLVMTWVGCAYNAKLRSHLSFDEIRARLPPLGQFLCVCLDTVLWLGFALIVIVTSLRQTTNSAANFQILLGTDNVQQWWFYVLVPTSWLILSARTVENFLEDLQRYRTRQPLLTGQFQKIEE